jgi:anti-anti-sigma factor
MSPDPASASAAAPSPVTATGLNLRNYTLDGATVVVCGGRLTLEHAERLKTYVRDLMPSAKGVILDMKDVSRMDSAGLGALVALYISAKKAHCELLLANYNQSIKDLLGLTNLLTMFESAARTGMRIP